MYWSGRLQEVSRHAYIANALPCKRLDRRADFTTSAVADAKAKLQSAIDSFIANLHPQTLINNLWRKFTDLKTWVDLSDDPGWQPPGSKGSGGGSTDGTAGEQGGKRSRVQKVVRIAFKVSEQYPDEMFVFVVVFLVGMLGVAVMFACLTNWNMRW